MGFEPIANEDVAAYATDPPIKAKAKAYDIFRKFQILKIILFDLNFIFSNFSHFHAIKLKMKKCFYFTF